MNFYIPVEVKDRELYAKLLLAKYAAENGFNVILGKKNDLNRLVLSMPQGIYYGLGIAENYNDFFKRLSQLGHIIVVGEEEGLITYSDEMYLDMRISPETIKYVDLIFTWGKENYNIISSGRKNNTSKLRITGNPRFDLLKPSFSGVYDAHIKTIRNQYDDFILVCTSFPSCNHFIENINYVQSLIDKKTLRDKNSIDNFKRYQQVKTTTFKSFVAAIPLLAEAYSEIDIIIRPHPSENKEAYQVLSEKYNNVFIENKFSVHPWILCSKAVIHHYCTTSIEAFAADVPRFSLRPVKDNMSEKDIPFKCSNEFKSVEGLIGKMNDIIFNNEVIESELKMKKEYEHYVFNMGAVISSDLIIKEIVDFIKINPPKTDNKRHFLFILFREYTGRLEFILSNLIRKLFMKNGVDIKYGLHKFDRLSLSEIKEVLNFYTKNNSANLQCQKFDKNFVRISMRKINS